MNGIVGMANQMAPDNFKGSAGVLAKAIVMLREWAKQNQ